MKHRWFLILLCAILMSAYVPCALMSAGSDPFVVQVGNVGYPLSEVQAYWDNLAQSYLELGQTIDANQIEWYEQSVIDAYIKMGVLQNKLIEFGLNDITPEDAQEIEKDAQKRYDEQLAQYVQQIIAQYGRTEEEAKTYAQTFMDLDGMTMEQARALALSAFKEKRILDYTTADVQAPTEEELQAYYTENLVQPSKEAYAATTEQFEQSVVLYGTQTYYYPSGYRFVRQILLPASAGTYARARVQAEAVAKAKQTVQSAENALYGLKVLGEDEAAANVTLNSARQALEEAEAALNAIYAENLARYAEQIKDIETRLSAGESFDSVMAAYPADETMPEQGYLVSADSFVWEEPFRDGAMALQAIGNVSAPVSTIAGVHFLQYTADAPDGAPALEGELLQKVTDAALLAKRYAVLEGFIEDWRAEYQITTSIRLLSTPDCLQ